MKNDKYVNIEIEKLLKKKKRLNTITTIAIIVAALLLVLTVYFVTQKEDSPYTIYFVFFIVFLGLWVQGFVQGNIKKIDKELKSRI